MAITKSILLACHDRSGSNLIKSILNQHPDIYIVPSLPIFEQMYWYMNAYGDLSQEQNWQEFLEDVIALYNSNHHPLPIPLTASQLHHYLADGPRTLGYTVQTIYHLLTASQGRTISGIKFGAHQSLIDIFVQETDFSHVIFQWRDPRDVTLSQLKSGFMYQKPAEYIQEWLVWHRTMRQAAHAASKPALETRYEDLLNDPEQTLSRIWRFLDIPHCSEALDFYRNEQQVEAAKVSHMWQNLAKPLIKDNYEKFYSEWNYFTIKQLEWKLGAGLKEFGYEPAQFRRFASCFRSPKPRQLSEKDKAFHKPQEEVLARIIEKSTEAKKREKQAAALARKQAKQEATIVRN